MFNTGNLDRYFQRIHYSGEAAPVLPVLRRLHVAHATQIPFENIDVLLGRPISLDINELYRKLVIDRRGGYCFEQNSLFAAILEQIGFRVIRLAARVRLGSTRVAPRTHMLLAIDIDSQLHLADVGFGGACFLEPIPLKDGFEAEIFGWRHRLKKENEIWVLSSRVEGSWIDQYSFTLEPQFAVDYEVANYYVSTIPTSHFRQILVAQAQRTDIRYALHNAKLIESRGSDSQQIRTIEADEITAVLAQLFGIELLPGTPIPIASHRQTTD